MKHLKLELINMKENNWIENTNKVKDWLAKEDRGTTNQAIELSIMLGNDATDDDGRTQFWSAIRAIGGKYEDFPLARRGNNRTAPQNILDIASSVKNRLYDVFVAIGEPNLVISIMRPHGRTGGVYATIEDYATAMAAWGENEVLNAYKKRGYMGEMNGDNPVLPPVVSKKQMEVEEEEWNLFFKK